jgi:hypothetical protein
VIFAKSVDELQMAALQLSNVMANCNFEICDKMDMAFCGKYQIR